MHIVECLRDGTFRTNTALLSLLITLSSPSYINPATVIQHHWKECDTLYLLWDENEQLICFYFAAFEEIIISSDGETVPTRYMGLSVTRQNSKNLGSITSLWAQFLADSKQWEQNIGRKLYLWYTTASPTVYRAGMLFSDDANPQIDTSYDSAVVPLALALRTKLGLPQNIPSEHPFVLRGISKHTLYSPTEVNRNDRVNDHKKFTLDFIMIWQ